MENEQPVIPVHARFDSIKAFFALLVRQFNEDGCRQSAAALTYTCLLYTSPSPRDCLLSRMPSSA